MKKRLLSVFLSFVMCLSLLPINVFAEGDGVVDDGSMGTGIEDIVPDAVPDTVPDTVPGDGNQDDGNAGLMVVDETAGAVTKNVDALLTGIEVEGLTVQDGKYYVQANKPYSIFLSFQEKLDLDMDMTDQIFFTLPEGVIASSESGSINIGVEDENSSYKPIYHDYTIDGNVMTITWNQDSEYFEDLSRAPYVKFTFGIQAKFDGTVDEISFGTDTSTIIKVDNTGSVTITKDITGLESGVTMSDAQKEAMTFELLDEDGNVVESFSYADMKDGAVTFEGIKPGKYTVRETGYPEFTNHTFDTTDSKTSAKGELANGGVLNLALTNDYEYDTGNLVLNKSISSESWDPATNDLTDTTVPDEIKNNITFKVTGPGGYSKEIAYTNFTGGKYTLEGLKVGEYTITETNNVTGYTWTYKVNNAAAANPSANATITKGGTAEASFENTYKQKTADLTIKKTASGAEVPANTQFKVTFPDGETTRTFTYSQMTNGSYTFENVPLGTYQVEEIDNTAKVTNYKLTVTGEGDYKLSTADSTETATIKNTYTPLGSLKINKTVTGANLKDAQKKAMKFRVYDSANKLVGERTYKQILEGNDTISLPVGSYTVQESGANIDGYTVVTDPADGEESVNVELGKTSTASFTNTYTKNEYKITVEKIFGEGSAYDSSNLPENIKNNTKFTIKKGNAVFATCTYAELAEKMTNLPLTSGGDYTITETNPSNLENLSITTQVSTDGEKFSEKSSIKVTVKNHELATVTFKNTYTKEGKIKGDKTVVGLPSYEASAIKGKIRFVIYRKDEKSGDYIPYKESVTLAQLQAGIVVPVGYYYVEETGNLGVEGYDGPSASTKVQVTGSSSATRNGGITANFEVKQGGEANAQFTNSYKLATDKGELKLVKHVKGLGTDSDEWKVLTSGLNVTNKNGDPLYDGIRFKLEEKLNNKWYEFGTYTIAQLAAGSGIQLRPGDYRITELNAEVTNHILHVDYEIKIEDSVYAGQADSTVVEFKVEKNSKLEVHVYNAYTKLGSLKVTKKIDGANLNEAARKNIKFTVKGPLGFEKTFTYNDIYNNGGAKVFDNIPVGEYTVTETADDTELYKKVSTICTVTDGKITVADGHQSVVGFTNTYARKVGSLKIIKKLDGGADQIPVFTEEQKRAMTFTVKDSSGAVYDSVTYKDFVEGTYYTFENVPTGTYTVEETISGVLTDTYQIVVTNNNASAAISDGKTTEVTITNHFTKTGSLTLKKTFAGAEIPAEKKNSLQFQYWKIDENGAKIGDETVINYSDFTDGVYTVQNLTPGRYIVAEMDNTTGYTRVTTVQVNDGEAVDGTSANVDIAFGENSEVTFNNTYGEVASLKITKEIKGNLRASKMTEAQKKAIAFTVTGPNDFSGSFTYNDIYPSGEIVYTDLAIGEYTVTETITDPDNSLFGDYSVGTSYKIGSATAESGSTATFTAVHGENTVVFTNKYTKISPIKVEKHSSKTYVGMAEKDNVKLPVWKFTLDIENLNPLTTNDGTTTLTDVFDASYANWFRLATEQEAKAADKDAVSNVSIASLEDGKDAPSVKFVEEAAGTNTIEITGITDETAEKCVITYYLIIKDADTLHMINKASSENQSNGVSYNFKNTVTYHPMPHKTDTETVDATYEYKFTALNKSITNLDANGNLVDKSGNLVNYADYSVILNKDGVTIGNQSTITAIDTFSANQMVLLSSIKTDPTEGVSYKLDNEKDQIEFTIPNGTPVEVTYRVQILDSESAKVELTNEIQLLGFVTSVEQQAVRSMGGAGMGKVYAINLIKVDALNNNMKLDGVTFGLYDGKNNTLLVKQTTDAFGKTQFKFWGERGALKPNYPYYVKEEGTRSGYNSLGKKKIWFSVGADTTPAALDEEPVTVLNNGGELIIENEPVHAVLEVTKEFNDWSKQSSFAFKLEPVGNAPMPVSGATVVTTEANPTGTFGAIRYDVDDADFANGATVTYRYTIQEVVSEENMVDGILYDTTAYPVTVTISDADGDGVKEVAVSYGENNASSLTVTNTYETVKVSGGKVWNDNNDQDGLRPASITVVLLADGVEKASMVTDVSAEWKYKFENLPKYHNNRLITYTVKEEYNGELLDNGESFDVNDDDVADYTVSYSGNTITNTHNPATTSLSGEKKWEDDKNRDGLRPASITVILLADGEKVREVEVTGANDNWKYTFTDLPKFEGGKLIEYTVAEAAVPEGYTAAYAGNNIINTHTPEKISISGKKSWNDKGNDVDHPVVTVNLYANEVFVKSTTVNADGTYTFADLLKFEGGKEIVYTVKEVVPADYDESYNGFDITNTLKTTEISGKKIWADEDNRDGMRPASVTVVLMADGVKKAETTVTGTGNEWAYEFKNLPETRNGVKIKYTVEEVVPEGYTVSYGSGNTITNTYTPVRISVSGKKIWDDNSNQDGKRPGTIKVILKADGEQIEVREVSGTGNEWSYTFENLYKFRDNGTEIEYTVAEEHEGKILSSGDRFYIGNDQEADYTVSYSGNDITNTHTPVVIDISGKKVWDDDHNRDGVRPELITVILKANGNQVKEVEVTGTGDEWSYTFTDLPKYENGQEIEYTVAEKEDIDGYTTTYADNNIINTHTPEKISLSGKKSWNDKGNDVDHPVVTVNLYANEVFVKSTTVNADTNWAYTFADLLKFEGGKEIVYTVKEVVPADYDESYNGFDITNTLKTTEISGKKIWADEDNRDGMRPTSVTVVLLADGERFAETTVTGTGNEWAYKFENLPLYRTGTTTEVEYTVVEEYNGEILDAGETVYFGGKEEADYTVTYADNNITNTHIPERISISGTKTWDDKGNQLNHPVVTVKLYANNEFAESTTVNADGTYKFENLLKYEGGVAIEYRVEEVVPADYTVSYNGYNITNTLKTTSISGTKSWNDKGNTVEHPVVTVNLYADEAFVKSTTVNADGTYKFENLPKTKGGEEIVYTVQEVVPADYEASYDGYAITNTLITTEVSGKKIWEDDNDRDGIRPTSVTVILLADGVEVKRVDTNAASDWAYKFVNLPMYQRGTTTEVKYTVIEETVPAGYTEAYPEENHNIINTHEIERISIEGEKSWDDAKDQDGLRPDSVVLELIAVKPDGTEVKTGLTTTAYRETGWRFKFENVKKYGKRGENDTQAYLLSYKVIEAEAVEGYEVTQYGLAENDYTVVNTHIPETMDVTVNKVWADYDDAAQIRPKSILVSLYADGVKVGESVTLTQENGWSYTWKELPKYTSAVAPGTPVVYTTIEEPVEHYTESYDGLTITNTVKETEVAIYKYWDDNDDEDNERPDSITVDLLRGNKVVKTITLTAKEKWRTNVTWYGELDDLTVRESDVPEDYYPVESELILGKNGYYFTITNIYTGEEPENRDVKVKKVWIGGDKERPAIRIRLYRNGVEYDTITLYDGKRNYVWKDINVKPGIDWSVEELNVPKGYEVSIQQVNDQYFIITNTWEEEENRNTGA